MSELTTMDPHATPDVHPAPPGNRASAATAPGGTPLEAAPAEARAPARQASHFALLAPTESGRLADHARASDPADRLRSELPTGAIVTMWAADRLLVLSAGGNLHQAREGLERFAAPDAERPSFVFVFGALGPEATLAPVLEAAEIQLRAQIKASRDSNRSGRGIRQRTAPYRILLVEDDPTDSLLLLDRLEREDDLQVTLCEDGADALELVSREVFDLAVLDGMLPGVSGFTLLARIREMRQWAHIPVVMLTGKIHEDAVVRGLALGADDYIGKPFSPVDVLARLRRLLKSGRPDD